MATYYIHQVTELPEDFIEDLGNELALEFSKHNTEIDLSNGLRCLPQMQWTVYLLTIDETPQSVIIGMPEDNNFRIINIFSKSYKGTRDYLYESAYFECLNNKFIEDGYTGKIMITPKTARDDNWIRRTCTEHPLADSYAPTLEETETHSIWTWSFS